MITCWGNVEKGFIMESSDSCLESCSIYIKVSLTEHSKSGTYYLELNETRCPVFECKNLLSGFQTDLLSMVTFGIKQNEIYLSMDDECPGQ